jgi:hypothetical protein
MVFTRLGAYCRNAGSATAPCPGYAGPQALAVWLRAAGSASVSEKARIVAIQFVIRQGVMGISRCNGYFQV